MLVTAVDSLFGTYRVRHLLGSWPFEDAQAQDSIKATGPIEEIALELFYGRSTWYAATEALRAYYEDRGEFRRALQAGLAMIQ